MLQYFDLLSQALVHPRAVSDKALGWNGREGMFMQQLEYHGVHPA